MLVTHRVERDKQISRADREVGMRFVILEGAGAGKGGETLERCLLREDSGVGMPGRKSA